MNFLKNPLRDNVFIIRNRYFPPVTSLGWFGTPLHLRVPQCRLLGDALLECSTKLCSFCFPSQGIKKATCVAVVIYLCIVVKIKWSGCVVISLTPTSPDWFGTPPHLCVPQRRLLGDALLECSTKLSLFCSLLNKI